MERITEKESNYRDIDKMSVNELLYSINQEDSSVSLVVKQAIPQIEKLIPVLVERVKQGGRLFYLGAGTSGRLGIVDASECPPTFGVDYDLVIALIAGGDAAIRKAVEDAEDQAQAGWTDLLKNHIQAQDCVIGIAASGTTPYVLGALNGANELGCLTACIVCNPASPVAAVSQYPIEVITGPEFLTGSTRMKAGTATKMVLNMISTSLMIGLGKVRGNKMVNMRLANDKLRDRALHMLMTEANIEESRAKKLIEKHGNVQKALAELSLISNK